MEQIMKHIVLGKGNLGQALNRAIYRETNTSPVVSYREEVQTITDRVADHGDLWVWVTEGFGSVGECKKDPYGAFDLHVKRVHEIIHRFPKSNLVFFSTNYVAGPKSESLLSEYASSKALMETVVNNARYLSKRTNIWGVRVANLYSKYSPWKSFAGRLMKAREAGNTIKLPTNAMIPTDTDWLADRLMANHQGFPQLENGIFDMGPTGDVTTKKFGEIVLGSIVDLGIDNERPYTALLEDPFPDNTTWYDVWNSAHEYRRSLNLSEITPDQL
jgi:dTDP-4-dehydrorhamnose reductase